MNLLGVTAKASFLAVASLSIAALSLQPAYAAVHNVPKVIEVSTDQGRVAPDKVQTVTLFLKIHDKEAFDKVVAEIYDPASPHFRQFLTDADFAKYAPTAAEVDAVKKELLSHGLSILTEDPRGFSIRASGTTAQAEEAFGTELHAYTYGGKSFQANVRDARLTGSAGDLVETVAGLERHQVVPALSFAKNPRTGKALAQPIKLTAGSASPLSTITGTPLSPAALFNYGTQGSLPVAAYYGNVYDAGYAANGTIVAYTPAELQAYYGLAPLYAAGYDGTGQTIALVEGFGYSAAEADANTAAALFGLPPFTGKNFAEIYPEGKPITQTAGYLSGWNTEIALDVQTAHAIAPGAKIVVVASAGQDDEDQIASLNYIITHKIANTVSNSWENANEYSGGPAQFEAFNTVLELGVAAGISFQFSSGDGGDLGLGTPVGDVSVPSDSPYATAVGGTSILNDTVSGGYVTTGWGNAEVYLDLGGVLDPPFGFLLGGAGGGESVFFAKPSWQAGLPGKGRQVPDVSALADPNTGVAIVVTEAPGGPQYFLAGIGGTSLASPLFTATWAIADQYNGKPLGFAAPIVAKLTGGAIRDVLPTSDIEAGDVAGTIFDTKGATFYSADGLFAGLTYSQKSFASAIFNFTTDDSEAAAVSFGTDSSLTVTPGWDNVTGYGEPNGLPFIQGVTGKTTGAPVAKK